MLKIMWFFYVIIIVVTSTFLQYVIITVSNLAVNMITNYEAFNVMHGSTTKVRCLDVRPNYFWSYDTKL